MDLCKNRMGMMLPEGCDYRLLWKTFRELKVDVKSGLLIRD
jgi:hypothetical protein